MGKLLGILFAFLFCAALAEGGGYALSQYDGVFEDAVFDGIRLDDSVLTLKRHYTQRWRSPEFDVTLSTNSSGFRENKDFTVNKIDVAFFGDSFTWGHGVNADERYSDIFAKHFPDQRVASLAYACGFQPEHYEFYLNSHPGLAPKLAVVGLYLGNDLDSYVRETWINKSQDGRIDDVQLPHRGVFNGMLVSSSNYKFQFMPFAAKHSYFFRYALSRLNRSSKFREYVFEPKAVIPALNSVDTERGHFNELNFRALDSLVRLGSIVKERGGRLIILIIPQNYLVGADRPYIRPELIAEIPKLINGSNIKNAVEAFCRASSLECLDPTVLLSPQDYFSLNGHWTVSGHVKVGEFLAKHEREALRNGLGN
jgi:hypothetical protein